MEWLRDVVDIVAAILMCIGGLKIIARYTNTKADDKVLAAIEKPLKVVLSALKKDKK